VVDYHTHTKLCKHARGEIKDYILMAIEKNLTEIGVSDHMPLPDDFDPEHRMTIDEFEIYKDWYKSAVDEFGERIKIKFGIEAEFIDEKIDFIRDFVRNGDFDYVIGSVHFLDGWNIASHKEAWKWEGKDVNEVYEDYYQTIKKLVKSGIFDIVGHFDMIKKFGHHADKNFEELIREILKLIKENGLCIEINTSGLRHKVGEIYPSVEILKIAREYKIPLTVGSDAHSPEDIGRDFDTAYELIQIYGGGKISIFEKRERKEVSLRSY